MKTIVYVDGFNLYYRALKKTGHKWLNLYALCQAVLPKTCDIIEINFYTARISAIISPTAPIDQNTYLNALKTIPEIKLHFGNFQVKDKNMFLAQPLAFIPSCQIMPDPLPKYARVVKSEEKGSDVNLGVHLVRDALMKKMDHAAVITNDTDLCEPLRIVVNDAQIPLTLMTPVRKPSEKLRNIATFVRYIDAYLGAARFPDQVVDKSGRTFSKPADW